MFHMTLIAEDTTIILSEHHSKETAPLVLTAIDGLTGKRSEPTPITFEEAAAVLHGLLHPDSLLPHEATNAETGELRSEAAKKQREQIEHLLRNFPPECRPIA